MVDLTLLTRHQYIPSGKTDVSRFLAGSILLVFLSCLSGCISGLLYSEIAIVPTLSYVALIVPIAISLLLSLFVAKFVNFSHCRNPWVAASAGALCGILTFLSASQTEGVVTTLRDGDQTKLVAAAVRTDQVQRAIYRRVFGQNRQQQAKDSHAGFNFPQLISLIIEIGIFVWIPVNSGRNFARRAYGESIDRWLDRSVIRSIPGSGDRIISALEAREYLVQTLSSLPNCSKHSRTTIPTYLCRLLSHQRMASIAGTWMVLEVSTFPAANGAYEAYLSATEIDPNGKTRPLFQQMKLRTHEIPTSRKLFLNPSAERSSSEANNLNDDDFKVETANLYVRWNSKRSRTSTSRAT